MDGSNIESEFSHIEVESENEAISITVYQGSQLRPEDRAGRVKYPRLTSADIRAGITGIPIGWATEGGAPSPR